MLNLNWQIIWTFVNIIVLFLLLKKFLFSRVTRIMDEREALINGNIEQAEQQSREAEELKTRYEAELANAKAEAASIVAEAKARGQKEYDKQLAAAREDAARVMQEANRTIEEQRAAALDGLKASIAGIALAAASKVLEKNLSGADNEKMVDELLSGVGVRDE